MLKILKTVSLLNTYKLGFSETDKLVSVWKINELTGPSLLKSTVYKNQSVVTGFDCHFKKDLRIYF